MNYNRSSYRDADVGETHSTAPRVNSSHLRRTYSKLVQLSEHLNFNSPVFDGMLKRNRSLGSVQAFIVELALADTRFVEENLKPFCIADGSALILTQNYNDSIYFDRLEAITARRRKRLEPSPALTAPAPPRRKKQATRQYWQGE